MEHFLWALPMSFRKCAVLTCNGKLRGCLMADTLDNHMAHQDYQERYSLYIICLHQIVNVLGTSFEISWRILFLFIIERMVLWNQRITTCAPGSLLTPRRVQPNIGWFQAWQWKVDKMLPSSGPWKGDLGRPQAVQLITSDIRLV